MQVDFNDPNNPEIKDVYLGFDNLPLNQRAFFGVHKRPQSLDQWNSSRFTVFVERPTVAEAFNEDIRYLGAAMWGVSDAQTWAWQYGLYSLEGPQDDGRIIGDSMQLSGNARLGNTFLWRDDGRQYAWFGASAMVAHPEKDDTDADTEDNEARFRAHPEARSDNRWIDTGTIVGADWYQIAGLEAVYNEGPLQIVGEWMTNWTQRDAAIAGTPADLRFQGGYVYVSYFLTGEHIPWDRDSGQLGRVQPFTPWTPWRPSGCKGWGALNVAARYSYMDLTDENVLGGMEQNGTVALNWHWTAYAKLQYDVGYGQIEDHAPVGGFTSGNFWTSGLRFACDF
jgi:phosphate-selective porin OprO/OprP